MEIDTSGEDLARKTYETATTSNDRRNDDQTEIQSHVIEEKISSGVTENPISTNASQENSIDSTTILDSSEDSILTATATDTDTDTDTASAFASASATFKKPTVLIGPKRFRPVSKITNKTSALANQCSSENTDRTLDNPTKAQPEPKDPPFPYAEPPWGGKSEQDYKIEVLKSGVIIETIMLNERGFYVVGRLPSCHVSLAHPTVSRYHAVLQYRSREDGENHKGFYVYDLGSTHGTFWNGSRLKPYVYVRIRGGHMLRFGCSQRKYILQAPQDDQEEESPYTLSELKEMRASQVERQRVNKQLEESVHEKENDGIDWGMGEDADEETDLQENPYACITDDDFTLDDPKKTLRGWFESEGYELQYQTEEKGIGQFLCWVDLPVEDVVGHTVRAEAVVKGKKKEAVVQCALEACKILDKYGLLRQANHEARKRKTRNWEAEDYYDSDEDNFLDRTGSVEKKREQRMRLAGKLEDKAETYDSLLEKHEQVAKRISHLSSLIENWQNANNLEKETTEEDALDAFMSSLNSSAFSKSDIAKMKVELQNLRKEESSLIKLLNLTRPANLPPLVVSSNVSADQITCPVKGNESVTQQTPSEANKIQDSLFRRRKEKQANERANANRKSHLPSTTNNAITDITESKEELDSDDADEDDGGNDGNDDVQSTFHPSCASPNEKIIESAIFTDTISDDKNESLQANEEQSQAGVRTTKKRRQEQRKINFDHDIYTDNYSMWVPPQDQKGDGKTSLNEKYGY